MTTVTVKASGGDYTTVQAALDACPADITAAGTNQTWEIECYASVSGQPSTVPARTTDATHYIRIYTPSAERHNGISGGFGIESNTFSFGIDNPNTADLIIEGIRFTLGSSGNGSINIGGAATRRCIIRECLFVGSGGTYGAIRIVNVTGGTIAIVNNIKSNASGGGSSFLNMASGSGHTVYGYNNTIRTINSPSEYIFKQVTGTCVLKNNIAVHSGGSGVACYNGTFTSSSNNTSSDGTAPGTSSKTSVTPTFVDAANGDLHLDSGDTVAKDSGVDLSADANYAFSTDIDGQTRSGTWDIGADEIASAGGGIPKTTKLTLLGVG